MTNREKKVKLIVLVSVLGIVIYLSFKLRNDEDKEILANHHKVIGVVSNVGMKTIEISYTINGEVYSYTQNKPYSGIALGEEFYTIASKKNLNRALVYYTMPIVDTLKYKFAITKPIYIEKLYIDFSEILFTYQVGKIKYDRIQKYKDGMRPKDTHRLKVKYRIDRPEIGYLVETKN